MTITLDELTTTDNVRRNQWGQYLVVPPGKKKPVGYPRATTVAKELDNGNSLLGHYQRHTAMGLKLRPDLWAQVPTSFDDDTKRAFTALCDEAHDAGGGNARRDRGTAIHDALEAWVRFAELPADEQMAHNVMFIVQALEDAGFEIVPEYVEVMVVLDAFKIAGRMDMVLRHKATGTLYVGDLKTGSSVNYGQLSWATQLAIYAGADNIYSQGVADDGSDDVRLPMPEVDRDRAVIVHRNEDDDSCAVYWLDITAGREALDVAMAARGIKKRKGLLTQIDHRHSSEQTTSGRGSTGDGGTSRPARIEPASTNVDKPDEVCAADPAHYARIQEDGKALSKDALDLVLRWRAQPKGYWRWNTAGDDGMVTLRRVAITEVAMALASFTVTTHPEDDSVSATTMGVDGKTYEAFGRDATARAALEEVMGDDVQSHPVGELLARLTVDECERMMEVLT